ncbi:hypothetical protein [Aquimarina algicola]|uniref:Uncharacterized protein n=1 Tax=Aquimarina algicola TaxID=2589995 RepID=A0A504J667_9FLAO|nr:hypothetical protein [Aquimarina algicola]TPN82180.1 hypothetical protein FHK87_22410 [Aquimarina algicola]
MFWNKKNHLPKEEAIVTITHKLLFLERLLGADTFGSFNIIESIDTKASYVDQKENCQAIFDDIKVVLGLQEDPIVLEFFWEKPLQYQENDDTTAFKTADLYQTENLKLGTYQKKENQYIVSIEMSVLRDHDKMVYTLAHELSHYILLAQKELFFNDETLTDLLVLATGFGSYWYAVFKNEETTGYLSKKEGLYALAWLSIHKNETISISDQSKTLKKYQDHIKNETTSNHKDNTSELSFLSVFLNHCINIIENKEVNDSFLKNVLLYNEQVKKGRASKFKKHRTDVLNDIKNEIQHLKEENQKEILTLKKAITQIELYIQQPIEDSFYNQVLEYWTHYVELRDQEFELLLTNFENNKKLDIETTLRNTQRTDLSSKLELLVNKKVDRIKN